MPVTLYSGTIAANAYQTIIPIKDNIKRVVLMGPAHRVYVKGMALSTVDYFATPFGNIPLDKATQQKLIKMNSVLEFDETHKEEHSLEVHLPFLQTLLNEFLLIPIVVGDVSAADVSDVLKSIWNDETLIIVSSDLSHFHHYDQAKLLDKQTTTAIESFNIESIGSEQACGCRPMNGLLQFANENSLSVKTLDVRNSGDTAGTKDRVVGYGAYAII